MHRAWRLLPLAAALSLAACVSAAPPPSASPAAPASPTAPAPAASPSAAPGLATPEAAPTSAPAIFTLALPAGPVSLDPASAVDSAGQLITRHIYEGLTAFEPGSTRVRPALAEAWSTTGLTWTFQLRAGVTFADGRPVTAEAARRNFERWRTRNPAGDYRFWRLMFGGFAGETDEAGTPLSNIAAVSAPSRTTLVLRLRRPDAALPNTLAMPAFALVSPGAWSAPDFGQPGAASAGTGPFMLRSWTRSGLVELERNPSYWGTPALPDGLVFKAIPDDVQRVTALQVGEVDGLAGLPADQYDLASRWPALRVEFQPPLEVLYLGINQARAPWQNLDCRLAVARAIDPARYARAFFPGDAQPAQALQPAGLPGFAAPASPRAPDPAAASALWQACRRAVAAARAKWPDDISLYVPPIERSYLPRPAELGEAIRADLAAAGISVTVRAPDWTSAWLPDVQAGRADLFLLGWVGLNGDPDAYLCPLFCGANAAFNSDSAGLPIPPDDALAKLLRDAQAADDPAVRQALYAQAHQRIFDVVPAIPLTERRSAWAYRADLAGTIPSPIENTFFGLRLEPAP